MAGVCPGANVSASDRGCVAREGSICTSTSHPVGQPTSHMQLSKSYGKPSGQYTRVRSNRYLSIPVSHLSGLFVLVHLSVFVHLAGLFAICWLLTYLCDECHDALAGRPKECLLLVNRTHLQHRRPTPCVHRDT